MPSTTKAKSQVIAQLVRLARRERLSDDEFTYVCQQARKKLALQLLSGHASKKSLEIYQHLSLDAVEGAYQQAVKLLEV